MEQPNPRELTKVPNPLFPNIRDIKLYVYPTEVYPTERQESMTRMIPISSGLRTSAHFDQDFDTLTSAAMFTFP
jgi:hypothetical protein